MPIFWNIFLNFITRLIFVTCGSQYVVAANAIPTKASSSKTELEENPARDFLGIVIWFMILFLIFLILMCAFYKNVYYTFDKAINFQTDRFLQKEYVTTMQIRFPVGIENFKRIYTEGCYYVDKTGLIRDLLQ